MEDNGALGNEQSTAAPAAAAANETNQSPAVSDATPSQDVNTNNRLPPEVSQPSSTPSANCNAQNDKEEKAVPVADSDVTSGSSSGECKSPVEQAPTVRTEVRTRELTAVDKLNEHDVTSAAAGNPEAVAVSVAAAAVTEPTNGIHKMSAHEMDLAELKVKIICLEKNNMAMKMELKCAELQVAAKEKLDVKKTRLIELLDAKLSAVDKKNARLVEMLDQLIKEKNEQSLRLMEASKTIEDISGRMVAGERFRNDLQAANRDLKSMLENVEDKGSQLAKLAKEKVLKYKNANEKMQLELDGLKGGSSAEANGSLDEAVKILEEFHLQLQAALTTAKNWKQEESIDTLKLALDDIGNVSANMRTATVGFLQGAKTSAKTVTTSNNDDAQTSPTSNPPAASTADASEQLASKDREIANLKDELARLKAAIGQLVGLNQGLMAPPAADVK